MAPSTTSRRGIGGGAGSTLRWRALLASAAHAHEEGLAVGAEEAPQGPGSQESPKREWNNLFLHVVKGGPVGGGYSTVEDLWRFSRALQANTLLEAPFTQRVTTGKVKLGPESENETYAYGFFDEQVQGTHIVGHSGGFPGINSQLDIYLGKGYTVAVMLNYAPPVAHRVTQRVRALLLP
ncbi:serine hydrolase [Archangium sp.]|uniref:serine hydrolase n=1 Tax=Archangium sp. TaxID=1872627 RepID=UPI0038998AE8